MTDLPIDSELFDILVCPETRSPLKFVDGRLVSTDPEGRRAYRIDDGIPIMLLDESVKLDVETWQGLMDAEGPIGKAGVGL